MDARLIRFAALDPQRFDATLEWIRNEVQPQLERIPGYRTLFVGVNPKRGRAVAVTFWDSVEALKQSEPIEAPLRAAALERAGGDGDHALTDNLEVAVSIRGDAVPAVARLTRWSGLSAERARAGHELYEERMVPALRELPGFAGTLSATDYIMGKVLGVFFWDSRESMAASFEWERTTVAELDGLAGPRRPIIVDTYQVTVAPALGAHVGVA